MQVILRPVTYTTIAHLPQQLRSMQALQCFKFLAAKKMFSYETAAGATQIATKKLASTSARFIGWNFGKASPLPANYICNRPLKSHHFATLVRPLSAAMAAKSGREGEWQSFSLTKEIISEINKQIISDAGVDMKRAPDGSAFLTWYA